MLSRVRELNSCHGSPHCELAPKQRPWAQPVLGPTALGVPRVCRSSEAPGPTPGAPLLTGSAQRLQILGCLTAAPMWKCPVIYPIQPVPEVVPNARMVIRKGRSSSWIQPSALTPSSAGWHGQPSPRGRPGAGSVCRAEHVFPPRWGTSSTCNSVLHPRLAGDRGINHSARLGLWHSQSPAPGPNTCTTPAKEPRTRLGVWLDAADASLQQGPTAQQADCPAPELGDISRAGKLDLRAVLSAPGLRPGAFGASPTPSPASGRRLGGRVLLAHLPPAPRAACIHPNLTLSS